MSYLFSQYAGRSLPEHTLTVDEYVYRLDNELLSPFTASFGFKTYVDEPPLLSPQLLDEDKYIALFREHWDPAIVESAEKFNIDPDEFRNLIAPKTELTFGEIYGEEAELEYIKESCAIAQGCTIIQSIEEAIRQSAKKGTYVSVDAMAANHPTLQVNGLATVSEDSASSTTTNDNGNGHSNGNGVENSKTIDRKAAKLNMLKRMRPPPFTNIWTFWHDKYVPPPTPATATDAAHHHPSTTYENRLTLMYESIHDIKEFYQIYNHTPCEHLRQRDSFHLFKRGVKPVWEDARNVRGGSWTFRVPKEKSTEFWMLVQVIAVGEGFDDVVGKGDDICGLSLTTRFTSNLISVWNRDAANEESVRGILEVVLEELPEHLKPKESSYYYKKHSEHAGFKEVVAAAKAKEGREEGEVEEGEGEGEVEVVGDGVAKLSLVGEKAGNGLGEDEAMATV